MMMVRGVRGAITVNHNEKNEMLEATSEMLQEIMKRNQLDADDIASAIITVTDDLDAVFPAQAARDTLKWEHVPLMCAKEISIPGSLQKCIRVMLHVNTTKSPQEIQHVFLRDAVRLRPDLVKE
ncbi:chorismate mutase [Brevibacillus daliensis]|uniref:chorismate mutase n=1 Tax=Brevibacillus daliensis TaxID=2892995 RepID=UPI001E557B88|nr:chorismate mutase [Brevibacillus daliensis]